VQHIGVSIGMVRQIMRTV